MKSSIHQDISELVIEEDCENIPSIQIVPKSSKKSLWKMNSFNSSKKSFTSRPKKSIMVSSFLEDSITSKRQPLGTVNRDLRKSLCSACTSKINV